MRTFRCLRTHLSEARPVPVRKASPHEASPFPALPLTGDSCVSIPRIPDDSRQSLPSKISINPQNESPQREKQFTETSGV